MGLIQSCTVRVKEKVVKQRKTLGLQPQKIIQVEKKEIKKGQKA